MESTYQLTLAGPVPAVVAELVRDRFGDVTVRAWPGRTMLAGQIADQAAVRALLSLVWDLGCEIRLLRVVTG